MKRLRLFFIAIISLMAFDAEAWYGISPYAYCAGNPVNYVDPDGKDIHYLDEHGQITMTLENSEYDQVLFVDKKGEWVESSQYDYGTIEIGTEGDFSFMTLSDDKVGNEIFQMLADNTTIEWSQLKTDGPLGSSKSYISTSGKTGYEGTGISLINSLSREGSTSVREWNHNHPSGSLNPSGTRSGISNATGKYSEAGSYGDVGAAKMAEQKQPGIQMNIYANGKFQQFNSGGKVGLPFSYTMIGILTIKTPIWK